MGAEVCVHDPYVEHWWEFEAQDTYPAPGKSRARFFRGQEALKALRIESDLWAALKNADVVVLAVRHKQFQDLDPEQVVAASGGPLAIIDCFGMLNDTKIRKYFELECEVKGLGRGHISRLKKLYKEGATGKTAATANLPLKSRRSRPDRSVSPARRASAIEMKEQQR